MGKKNTNKFILGMTSAALVASVVAPISASASSQFVDVPVHLMQSTMV